MNLTSLGPTLTLLLRTLDSKRSTEPILKTGAQKPAFEPYEEKVCFEGVSPESQGISSSDIYSFIDEISKNSEINLHSIMMVKNGKVIYETSFGGQEQKVWKSTFSACKSITSLAIGMLVDEGKLSLDESIADIFSEETGIISKLRMKSLRVYHLLTMTSGVAFNEVEAMLSENWVKSYLSSSFDFEPGEKFGYNSLNTYMLSAIVRKKSGVGLSEYLTPRLFEPLGIEQFYWERCPSGIEKGGWGLYITIEDLAKIGLLVMQDGIWEEKRLISKKWLAAATSKRVEVPGGYGEYDYGFQIWTGKKVRSFLFNGMFGQNMLGYFDSKLMIITNAGDDEMFQQSPYFAIVHKYFNNAGSTPLPENKKASKLLEKQKKSLRYPEKLKRRQKKLPRECAELIGTVYHTDDENSASVGLLPLILQCVQNNYTRGIRELRFGEDGGCFYLDYVENDLTNRLLIGFYAPKQTEVCFHGEKYLVSTIGEFALDEDMNKVLKLKIAFLETACTRTIKFFYSGDNATLRQYEAPGMSFVEQNVAGFTSGFEKKKIIGSAISKIDLDFLQFKLSKAFSPRVGMKK